MRFISTLLLLLSFYTNYAQQPNTTSPAMGIKIGCIPWDKSVMQLNEKPVECKVPDINIKPNSIDTVKNNTRIIFRCGAGQINSDTPLLVIDGIPVSDIGNLNKLNPNDIVSFDILKKSEFKGLYGNRPDRGIIIITTKRAKLRKFIIKDFLDGNRIPGATISFISADKKDTIMMAANDSGVVVTDKLRQRENYSMAVSSIGYKTQRTIYQYYSNIKEKEVLLEKNVSACSEVVVTASILYRRIRCYCGGVSIIGQKSDVTEEKKTSDIKIFPNPAQKGKAITIETTIQSEGTVQIRLTSLDGKLLLSQPQKAFKGLNRFTINTDPRWAAGIYFVQLYANGKLLASDKVIIQ